MPCRPEYNGIKYSDIENLKKAVYVKEHEDNFVTKKLGDEYKDIVIYNERNEDVVLIPSNADIDLYDVVEIDGNKFYITDGRMANDTISEDNKGIDGVELNKAVRKFIGVSVPSTYVDKVSKVINGNYNKFRLYKAVLVDKKHSITTDNVILEKYDRLTSYTKPEYFAIRTMTNELSSIFGIKVSFSRSISEIGIKYGSHVIAKVGGNFADVLSMPAFVAVGHVFIYDVKMNNPELYNELLKELDSEYGNKVKEYIKKTFNVTDEDEINFLSLSELLARYVSGLIYENKETLPLIDKLKQLIKYILDKINKVFKDKNVITTDEIPANFTMKDLAVLLTKSKKTLLLSNKEAGVYITPDGSKFDTLTEAREYMRASRKIYKKMLDTGLIDDIKNKINEFSNNADSNVFNARMVELHKKLSYAITIYGVSPVFESLAGTYDVFIRGSILKKASNFDEFNTNVGNKIDEATKKDLFNKIKKISNDSKIDDNKIYVFSTAFDGSIKQSEFSIEYFASSFYNVMIFGEHIYEDNNISHIALDDLIKEINEAFNNIGDKEDQESVINIRSISSLFDDITEIITDWLNKNRSIIDESISSDIILDNVKNIINLNKDDIEWYLSSIKKFAFTEALIENEQTRNQLNYDPNELYKAGLTIASYIGAFTELDSLDILTGLLSVLNMRNELGEDMMVSATVRPADANVNLVKGDIMFDIVPDSNDVRWAFTEDIYSGNVNPAKKVFMSDMKRVGVGGPAQPKYPSTDVSTNIRYNLTSTPIFIGEGAYPEYGIRMKPTNFRLKTVGPVTQSVKLLVDEINRKLDELDKEGEYHRKVQERDGYIAAAKLAGIDHYKEESQMLANSYTHGIFKKSSIAANKEINDDAYSLYESKSNIDAYSMTARNMIRNLGNNIAISLMNVFGGINQSDIVYNHIAPNIYNEQNASFYYEQKINEAKFLFDDFNDDKNLICK